MSNVEKISGNVQISDDVLVTIVETASMEVEGVYSIISSLAEDIMCKITKKTPYKNIKIVKDKDKLTIDLSLIVSMGYKIMEVAEKTQVKVKNAIETMTGLEVSFVNVDVVSVEQSKKSED